MYISSSITQMVIPCKVYGVNGFKNNDANGGAMAAAIAGCSAEQIVFLSDTKKYGKVWAACSPEKFADLIKLNRGLYEVITKFPHKVYFDIDRKGAAFDPEFLPRIKATISSSFPGAEMAVSGSITEAKTSYHIVVQNYVIQNEDDRSYVKHTVRHLHETADESFDPVVYNKNRNMKIINQSKADGRVQSIVENDDFRAHCITCFMPTAPLAFPEMPEPVVDVVAIAKAHKTLDLSTLPKLSLAMPDDVDFEKVTPIQMLEMLPLSKANFHPYTHMTARFCYGNGLSFDQFMAWLQRKHSPITQSINDRWAGHWGRLDRFPEFSVDRMKSVLSVFYPDLKKDMFYRKFSKTFDLDATKVCKIDTISQLEFKTPEKFAIFNVGMGGGKTAQTVNFLKSTVVRTLKPLRQIQTAPTVALSTPPVVPFHIGPIQTNLYGEVLKPKVLKPIVLPPPACSSAYPNPRPVVHPPIPPCLIQTAQPVVLKPTAVCTPTPPRRVQTTAKAFCWICPNKALASNTFHRLTTDGVPCASYMTFNAREKESGALTKEDSMIIVANSLHYVGMLKEYDIIVIDEIETLIDKWFGNFMQHKSLNWAVFVNLIRKAKKVVLLDAFITTKTLNLIKSIDPAADMCIFERNNEKTNRTVNYVSSVPLMHKSIIDDLNAGLKLFIFYPMKKKSQTNAELIAMQSLYDMIVDKTGKKGVFYNADIDEAVKSGLKNVNEAWGDNSFVITNTMITCGVNYDNEDFDKEYIFIGSFNTPRDIIQVSYRPRHLTSGLINVCYLGKMRQTNTWEIDTKDMNCPIYTQMTESILVEKKSPLKKTFQLFCVKAHYAQKTDHKKLSEEMEKEIREMTYKYDMGYKYKDIPEIDCYQAQELEQKMFQATATMMDKITLQKFFYKSKFIEGCSDVMFQEYDFVEPVTALEYGWDKSLLFTFNQMERLMLKPANLFAKIQEHNGLPGIFPTNMQKMKISPEIMEQVFSEFKFKYVSKTSAVTKLYHEIYNSYFGTSIVFTIPDENKHVKYECETAKWAFFYEFVTEYSKRNPVNSPELEYAFDDDEEGEEMEMPDIV